MKDSQKKPRGPLAHRVAIGFFTIVLALLTYWSLDFFMSDIDTLKGPTYEEVESRVLSKSLRDQESALKRESARLNQQRQQIEAEQQSLQTSTNSLRETMNQLIEIRQQGTPLSTEEGRAFAESKRLFLSNQAKYQQLNEQLDVLRTKSAENQEKVDQVSSQLSGQREEARKQYDALAKRHEWKKAALKLLLLIPLLVIAFYFARAKRGSTFAPIIYAAGAAVAFKFFEVLHEYFPSRYFKYILMAIAIVLVVQVLLYLLRMLAAPKKDFLLKQYREAYQRFVCPVCEYPIRRGPLRYAFWTKRSIRKLALPEPTAQASDEAYACPACGTTLYEQCSVCGGTRHSMLPNCEKCGAAKEVVPVV